MRDDRQAGLVRGGNDHTEQLIGEHRPRLGVARDLDRRATGRNHLGDGRAGLALAADLSVGVGRCPGAVGRVPARRGEERARVQELDGGGRILARSRCGRCRRDAVGRDPGKLARRTAEVVHPTERARGEKGRVDQVQVHVPVGESAGDDAVLAIEVLAIDVPVSEVPATSVPALGAEWAHGYEAPITVRTANSSGKNVRSSARCKKPTPLDPPVPVFIPIVRVTTRRWRKRQN